MVHSSHRGKGIMKTLVSQILTKIKNDGFEWAFAKVHKDNFASEKSLTKNGFSIFANYKKPVKMAEFKMLSSQPFFSKIGKENASKTLSKYDENATEITVDYHILTKKL